jgi:hypothetical protein
MKHTNHIPSPPSPPFTPPSVPPLTHYAYVTVLLSLLILKSVFKGVSQCVPSMIYFILVRSTLSITLPYPFPPNPHYSTAFSTHSCIFYLNGCYIFQYCWHSSFSFHFLPPLNSRVAPLLQTYFTSKFVYDDVGFCIYVCRLDLSSTYER